MVDCCLSFVFVFTRVDVITRNVLFLFIFCDSSEHNNTIVWEFFPTGLWWYYPVETFHLNGQGNTEYIYNTQKSTKEGGTFKVKIFDIKFLEN